MLAPALVGLGVGPSLFPSLKMRGWARRAGAEEEETRASRRATRHLSAFAFHGARTRAGPVVADGVAPGSARGCSCEPHPRVPHPAPPSRRLMKAPLSGRDVRDIASGEVVHKNCFD